MILRTGIDLQLDAVYDWVDIVIAFNAVGTIERLHRRLMTKYETIISFQKLQTDFGIVRSYWRESAAKGDRGFLIDIGKVHFNVPEIERFLNPRRRLVTRTTNRPKRSLPA